MGSLRVLEAIRKTPSVKSLVYVTSDKCYKNNEWVWGYRETDELGGHDPYSASKAMAELLFASHWKSFFEMRSGFGAVTVRAGNVIGGGDFAVDRIVPDCVRASTKQEVIDLRNPRATRPWQHVLDPVFGYIQIGARLLQDPFKYSGAWNFGPNAESIQTVQQLVERFVRFWPGAKYKIDENSSHPHEAKLLHLNCDKAHQMLGWKPIWGFDTTIDETVSWYLHWKNSKNLRDASLSQIDRFMEKII
jgi:CDP-glucose 4,6-dehydratase